MQIDIHLWHIAVTGSNKWDMLFSLWKRRWGPGNICLLEPNSRVWSIVHPSIYDISTFI